MAGVLLNLAGRVVINSAVHGAIDIANDVSEREQQRRQQTRVSPGMTLQIVALTTVRSGPRVGHSQEVGELHPGELVTVVAEEIQVDGHQRVCIGEGRWLSRITARGTELAQQLQGPGAPMVAPPPVNTPSVSYTGGGGGGGGGGSGGGAQQVTRAGNAPVCLLDETGRLWVAVICGFVGYYGFWWTFYRITWNTMPWWGNAMVLIWCYLM